MWAVDTIRMRKELKRNSDALWVRTLTYYNTGNVHITYIQARSCNHCYRGKAASINILWEFVFVHIGIQHAKRMRHTAICELPVSTLFFYAMT